nr:MAG TPA: hypothetical protein [Siphoviridae sp. ctoof1]
MSSPRRSRAQNVALSLFFWGIIWGKIIRGMQGGEEERGNKGDFLFSL